jgi:hypothetical protein
MGLFQRVYRIGKDIPPEAVLALLQERFPEWRCKIKTLGKMWAIQMRRGAIFINLHPHLGSRALFVKAHFTPLVNIITLGFAEMFAGMATSRICKEIYTAVGERFGT